MSGMLTHVFSTLHNASTQKTRDHYQSALLGDAQISTHHSWRLSLLVLLVLTEMSLQIKQERALALALVHDLNFLNDPNFENPKGETFVADQKSEEGSHPFDLYRLSEEYEAQLTPEAQLVRALDLIEPFVRLNEAGTDLYIPQMFHENYFDAVFEAIRTSAQIYSPILPFLQSFQEQVERKYDHPEENWKEIIL